MILRILFVLVIPAAFALPCSAMPLTFDFRNTTSGAGFDLDEDSGSPRPTSVSGGGLTLTLEATATAGSNTAKFNQTGSSFGINAVATADESALFDDGDGVETMTFTITSSVPNQRLMLQSIDFSRFTSSGSNIDAASLLLADSTLLDFVASGSSDNGFQMIEQNFLSGDQLTLSFVGGNGFGLEAMTVAAVVPEPSTLALLFAGIAVASVRYRRQFAWGKPAFTCWVVKGLVLTRYPSV